MAETHFLSDLHLSPEDGDKNARFHRYLAGRARDAEALYILGDLFDAWVGDDDDRFDETLDALASLTSAGTCCLLMRGNRDFLIGSGFSKAFAQRTGCSLLRDPTRITVDGERILLMHGDLLCTDDIAYQRFRRRVRNPLVQWLFLRKSLASRQAIAADYRRRSAEAMQHKTVEIMDVNLEAVVQRMRAAKVRLLVHGHTHRPADHLLEINGAPARRLVLSDWREDQGELLVHRDGDWRREPIA